MTQAWVVRSLRADGYEQLAFDQGLVAVGWDAVGDLAALADQSHIRAVVRAAYPFVERESIEIYADQLHQFRSVLSRGDLIVLLRRKSPDAAIGWVTGEYRYRTDLNMDIRHVRSVRWARIDLPRSVVERELGSLQPLRMIFCVEQADLLERLQALVERDASTELGDEAPVSKPVAEESQPFANLQRNLNYARSLATAGQHLAKLQVGAFEVPDVFRAAWVQGVAALDHWVRQEIHTRMLLLARQPSGDKPRGFVAFTIPMGQVERVLRSQVSLVDVLDEQLAQTRGHMAYQHPDKIRDALSLVSDVKGLWNKVAQVLSERAGDGPPVTGADVQRQLIEIVSRRNKIAHEYDEDPNNPPTKRPIDAADVIQAIDWIEQTAAAILVALDED